MDRTVTVDPKYEYEAPQFYDFNKGSTDEDDQVDAWFDGKPDDEGGVPIIPEDFQGEDESEHKTKSKAPFEIQETRPSKIVTSWKQTDEPNRQQKMAKPIIKLKTSEEMEMERIAEMRKKTKNRIKANEHSMKKAKACVSYPGVRTRTEPTRLEEFHFETSKRVQPHARTTRVDDPQKAFEKGLRGYKSPVKNTTWKHRGVTVPKPFNLSSGNSTKRIHSTMEKDNQDTYETMECHVYKPPRFRTKKANEPKPELVHDAVKKPTPKVTCPKTPSSTKSRATAVAADVSKEEEKEQKERKQT